MLSWRTYSIEFNCVCNFYEFGGMKDFIHSLLQYLSTSVLTFTELIGGNISFITRNVMKCKKKNINCNK